MDKLDILFWRLDNSNSFYNNKNIVLLKPEHLVVWAIKELAFKEEKYNLLMDIYQGNRVDQQEKLVAYIAKELYQLAFKSI